MSRKNTKLRRRKSCVQTSNRRGSVRSQGINQNQSAEDIHKVLGIVERSVARSGLSYEAFVKHLTQTAFAGLFVWSESDLTRLLLAAERLWLDPLNGEIYAAQGSDDPMSPVLLVIGLNGWARMLNENAAFDGMEFIESSDTTNGVPDWISCTIHRKDRRVATTVREYLCEVKGEQGAWLTHPRRMLRHKALVQCARVCFGLVGIYDHDEAARIREAQSARKLQNEPKNTQHTSMRKKPQPSSSAALKSAIRRL